MCFSPSLSDILSVLPFAAMAPASVSYSTKAIPVRPGTMRTSRKPSYGLKIAVRASLSKSSGRFWTNRVLLGGRYSSGITAEAPEPVALRPAPRAFFVGRVLPSAGAPGKGRLRRFCSSAISRAFFLSVMARVSSELQYSTASAQHSIPFSAMRRRLWISNSSSLPVFKTVASLCVRARDRCISFL